MKRRRKRSTNPALPVAVERDGLLMSKWQADIYDEMMARPITDSVINASNVLNGRPSTTGRLSEREPLAQAIPHSAKTINEWLEQNQGTNQMPFTLPEYKQSKPPKPEWEDMKDRLNSLDQRTKSMEDSIKWLSENIHTISIAVSELETDCKALVDKTGSIATDIGVQVDGLHEEIRDLWLEVDDNDHRSSER